MSPKMRVFRGTEISSRSIYIVNCLIKQTSQISISTTATMVRSRLLSSILIAAAISVGSAAADNVAESSKVEKDVHEKVQVQAIDDAIDTSFKAEPKAVKKKLNNVESESTVNDNTAVPTAESPWTSFDVPSWLLKTKNFYKIDKSSSDDGKWSTIANAQVCSKFGTSSVHVTLSKKEEKNRSSLMINYRSDVFDDTTSTSGDYWYLTIVDGDVETKVAVSVGKRHSYKLQKITVNGEKVSLLTFRGVVGDGGGISSSTKSLLRDGLKAASDMNIFSTLPGDGKMGDMYDKFVNDLIREDTSGMGGGGGGSTRNTTDKKVCEESLDLKSDEQEN